MRGRVIGITTAGAEAHVDRLTRRYTRKQHFYGETHPLERRQQARRVTVIIEPVKVAVDAVFRLRRRAIVYLDRRRWQVGRVGGGAVPVWPGPRGCLCISRPLRTLDS